MSRTPDEVIKSLNKAYSALYLATEQMIDLAIKEAETEREYKVAFAKEILQLKSENQSITLIPKLAEGNKFVADFKFQYNVASEIYRIHRAKIDSYKTAVNRFQSELGIVKTEYQYAKLQKG